MQCQASFVLTLRNKSAVGVHADGAELREQFPYMQVASRKANSTSTSVFRWYPAQRGSSPPPTLWADTQRIGVVDQAPQEHRLDVRQIAGHQQG